MATESNILFICPSYNVPLGGVKQIYRQVDLLTELNLNAYVLHSKYNHRETWFQNDSLILYNQKLFSFEQKKFRDFNFFGKLEKIVSYALQKLHQLIHNHKDYTISSKDILVIPEILAHIVGSNFKENPKVIYVQGYGLINQSSGSVHNYDPYNDQSVLGILVNSKYSADFMKERVKKTPIFTITHFIDPSKFYPGKKKKQIAFTSVKLPKMASKLLEAFEQSSFYQNWEIVQIENINWDKVAKTLQETRVYVNLVQNEGFGLLAAEAMLSGCLVVGFDGNGGGDFMNRQTSILAKNGDFEDLKNKLFKVLNSLNSEPNYFENQVNSGMELIKMKYSESAEKESIKYTWDQIVSNLI